MDSRTFQQFNTCHKYLILNENYDFDKYYQRTIICNVFSSIEVFSKIRKISICYRHCRSLPIIQLSTVGIIGNGKKKSVIMQSLRVSLI